MDPPPPFLIPAEHIVDTLREPLLVLAADLRVVRANRSFYSTFAVTPQETVGRLVYELGNGQWDIPALHRLLEVLLPQQEAFDDFEVAHDFPSVGRKVMLLNARCIVGDGGGRARAILLAIEDITERRRLKDERRELETRFTSLVKNVRDHSIFMLDRDGHITSWNFKAERILGFNEAEVLGRHFSIIFTGEDQRDGIPEHELRTALSDGRAEDERWHLRKGGERFWALGIVTPIHDASGGHTGFSKILRDMTDRKRAEEALHQSERRLRALVNASADVVYQMSPDWSEMRQLDGQGFIVDTNSPSTAWFDRYIHPDDQPRVTAAIREAVRAKSVFELEHRVRRVDGTLGWAFSRAVPLLDPSGKIVEWIGAASDVTARKEAEDALRASEERYRRLVETAHEGIWAIDAHGRTTYVNRRMAELLGYVPEEMLGRIHTDFMWEQDRPKGNVDMERRRQRTAEVWDQRYCRKDGSELWTVASCTTLFDADGKLAGALGMFTDITGRKRAEAERQVLLDSERAARAEAERAGVMKDEFLAVVSHELRTPLTAILIWAKLLRGGATKGHVQSEALDTIVRSAEAQKSLIEDLLDVSRMLSGNLRIDVREADLGEIISQATAAVCPMAEVKGVHVETTLVAGVGPVRVDPDRIRQVVWNLLNNAVKFTDGGGQVRIALRRLKVGIEIRVTDTGRGIAPDFLPHVFERFRQQDGSTTRQAGGLGLGLAITRQLVELHGGSVRADSAGEGRGATFTVTLPLASSVSVRPAEVRGGASDTSDSGSALSGALEGIRVLVVEDDAATRTAIRWVLEQASGEVTAVESVDEALTAFAQSLTTGRRFAVLASDIGMPGKNGFELIREVRRIERDRGGTKGIPAVAISAYGRDVDRAEAKSAGFDTYVAKPVEPAALVEAVAKLAGRTGGAS